MKMSKNKTSDHPKPVPKSTPQPSAISRPGSLGNPVACTNKGGNNSVRTYPRSFGGPETYAKNDGKATKSVSYIKGKE